MQTLYKKKLRQKYTYRGTLWRKMYRYRGHIVWPARSPRRTLSSAWNDKRDSASHCREIRDENQQKRFTLRSVILWAKRAWNSEKLDLSTIRSKAGDTSKCKHKVSTRIHQFSYFSLGSLRFIFLRLRYFHQPSTNAENFPTPNIRRTRSTLRNSFLCARNSSINSAFSVFILETLGDERFLRNISYKTTLVSAVLVNAVQCWWIDAEVFTPLESKYFPDNFDDSNFSIDSGRDIFFSEENIRVIVIRNKLLLRRCYRFFSSFQQFQALSYLLQISAITNQYSSPAVLPIKNRNKNIPQFLLPRDYRSATNTYANSYF